MLKEEVFYAIKCDRCKECSSNFDDIIFWGDKNQAYDQADYNDWVSENEKDYCQNCYIIDEETDEVIIKPPLPKELFKLINFLDIILGRKTSWEQSTENTYTLRNSLDEYNNIHHTNNILNDNIVETIKSISGPLFDGISNVQSSKQIYIRLKTN